jgi:hypothetical protein
MIADPSPGGNSYVDPCRARSETLTIRSHKIKLRSTIARLTGATSVLQKHVNIQFVYQFLLRAVSVFNGLLEALLGLVKLFE